MIDFALVIRRPVFLCIVLKQQLNGHPRHLLAASVCILCAKEHLCFHTNPSKDEKNYNINIRTIDKRILYIHVPDTEQENQIMYYCNMVHVLGDLYLTQLE